LEEINEVKERIKEKEIKKVENENDSFGSVGYFNDNNKEKDDIKNMNGSGRIENNNLKKKLKQ